MQPVQIKILDSRLDAWGALGYQSEMAAGIDLHACIDRPLELAPQAPAVLIPTGIAVFMNDPGMAGMIYPRSGMGHKRGLVLGNGTGVIDADYQNAIYVSAWNRNPTDFSGGDPVITIEPGDRIAQLVFVAVLRPSLVRVNDFSHATERGLNGFGSTGQGVA